MYAFLRTLLGIIGIGIVIFHIKTYRFNRNNRNLVIASFEKDIRPYWLLWGIRLILLLFMLFYKGISVNGWSYISNRFENTKNTTISKDIKDDKDIKDSKNKNSESNNKYTPTNGGNTTGSNNSPINNTQRGIINEEQVQQIEDRSNIIINPIADGYYEIITSDTKLNPLFIETTQYIIPKPINTQLCDISHAYWNLRPEHLNYNGFIYDYINSHKEKDILVALLDSGIDGNNETLRGHTAKNSNEVKDGKDSDNDGYIDDIEGVNIVSGNGDTQDYNGHGTHVAGIVLQTFPNASILPIKITEGNEEYIDEYDIIKGLRYAIDANVNIISMSFGGIGSNEVTKALIKEATDKGIIVIAAAGNEGENVVGHYPASYTGVVNVGSIGEKGTSDFSNTNTDILLPGECIRSYGLKESKVFWGGTSMSAPHLAGVLGTYLSIGKDLGNESEILALTNKNSKTVNKNKIVDVTKLFGLEKDNNNAYKYVGTIDSTLETIQSKLNKLQDSKFTEQDLNSVASLKSTLSTNATSLSNLYSELGITNGFGVELRKDIDEYNDLLSQLNQGGLYLEVDGGTLKNSLGVRSCHSDYDTICDTFSVIIPKGTLLPANGSKKYWTMEDGQSTVSFDISQGENSKASLNKHLGNVTIYDLPWKSKGEAGATVYFSVNTGGKLQATATDIDNQSNTKKVTINSVAKDIIIITGDNYYKAKQTIDELIQKTELIENKIQNFYNLNPFNYIPETSNGSYKITKTEFNIPETKPKKDSPIFTGTKSNISENIKVDKVIDGDTVRVFINGESTKVRLIGVEAPESNDTRYGYTECYGQASSNYLASLLSNKTIGLEYDSTQGMYDKYDRILAYIFLNGENINKKMIEDGYAWENTYNLPYKYQSDFKKAESNAKQGKKGLWNKNTCNGEHKKGK